MNPLDSILKRPVFTSRISASRVVMGALFLFILWAMIAKLDEVAVATGEAVPQEQIQSIQHREGGIIEDIFAREGARVKKGQQLLQLNLTNSVANREELEINLQGMILKKGRLEAEAAGKEELVPDEAAASFRPEIINSEKQTFIARRQQLDSSLSVLKEQLAQKELDIQQLETERSTISNNLGLLREKLRISSDLVKDKLTSKLDHLQLASEVKELEGRLSVVNVAIPRAKAALAEAQERVHNADITFRNQAQEELTQVEVDIAKTREMLTRATDQVQRTTIKSPIEGVVKSLKTHTLGGVVQPGDTIMEIVPLSSNLIIEAKLNPNDIGFVKPGQKALVKILTYDYSRYGGLEGTVTYVSADSHSDAQKGTSYFLVKVQTTKSYLGGGDNKLFITPGMQATVDIHTGTKSVMEYLLKPILKIQDEAFRER